MTYRVDAPGRDTAWHDTEAAAIAEVARLRRAGVLAVAWEWGVMASEACEVAAETSAGVEMDPSYTDGINGAQIGAEELGGTAA